MAESITIKALQDASLDAKSLEEAVNGNEVKQVTTRLGETYPTLSNALNQIYSKLDSADAQIKQGITSLFENGGLPATPFATKALMESSELVDGEYAIVTGGNSGDTGLYVKRGASWVLQDFLNKGSAYDSDSRVLLNITDGNDETYAYFGGDGDLYLRGMRASVQDTIKGTGGNLDPTFFRDYMSEKLDFTADVIARNSQLSTNGIMNAPIPYEYAPLNYALDPSFVNLKISDPSKTIISTPYDIENNGKVVHPTVFQCRDTIAGFKYIMGITPFYNLVDALENPIIYGTNDFISYTLLTKEPLAHRPSSKEKADTNPYNSDIFFTYDYHTGDIVCGWREVHNEGGLKEYLRIKRSKDGKNWFGLQTIWTSALDSAAELFLSPSIVYNFATKKYDMYGVSGRSPYKVVRYSSSSLVKPNWTAAVDVNLIPPVGTPWHLDVRYAGDSLIAVTNVGSSLFASISKDNGLTWTTGTTNIFSDTHAATYKGSAIPVFEDENSMHIRYFWTTTKEGVNIDDWFNLKSAKTTSINY